MWLLVFHSICTFSSHPESGSSPPPCRTRTAPHCRPPAGCCFRWTACRSSGSSLQLLRTFFQTPVDCPGGLCGNNHKLLVCWKEFQQLEFCQLGFPTQLEHYYLIFWILISNQIFYYPLTWISYYLHSFHAFVYLAWFFFHFLTQ